MNKDEALKLALEALVDFGWHIENCPQFPTWAEPKKYPSCTCGYDTAKDALRLALEQPEQDPFGYFRYDLHLDAWVQNREGQQGTPFYNAPPKRKWVGLTDEEVDALTVFYGLHYLETPVLADFACDIEAKLKEKNYDH